MSTLKIEAIETQNTIEARNALSKTLQEQEAVMMPLLHQGSWTIDILRPEYPRPQFAREHRWQNLNGVWEFEMDFGRSGKERGLNAASKLNGNILLPFAPESKLSGIGYTDFIPAVWYRRAVAVPADWLEGRILLNIGACDYATTVYVNGQEAGSHAGGYTPFTVDVTAAIKGNPDYTITIYAEDDVRSGIQPKGKQAHEYKSSACDYTRTTGIWQTVWLEAVPKCYLANARITPQLSAGGALVEVRASGDHPERGAKVRMTALANGNVAAQQTVPFSGKQAGTYLSLSEVRPWSPEDPFLYDLTLELLDAENVVVDRVYSYFGLRTVAINGCGVEINGKPVFQRLILDQGFYPDGIYTAPSETDLKRDIDLGLAMGFNGARLHQKVFEPRYLYWCDRMGYLVWGEAPDWGVDINKAEGLAGFMLSWVEQIERDFNHPSIVGWCPYNEHYHVANPEAFRSVYKLTKAYDATRPVIDASGWVHVETDIYDVHDYMQDPQMFAGHYDALISGVGEVFSNAVGAPGAPYKAGTPYMVSEYGGIQWSPANTDEGAWGYGAAPKTEGEFVARFRGLTEALLFHPKICGFCYTQLTDVEQEVNGLYYYDRTPKFDPALFREVNIQQAAIERAAEAAEI